MKTRLDVLMLVPFQPNSGWFMDPPFRQLAAPYLFGPLLRGYLELCEYLRFDLDFSRNHPVFDGQPLEFAAHRSLGAVTLATHLERAGLAWHVIDSGMQDIRYWREKLDEARARQPRAVAVSTTFLMSAPWLRALCAEIRRALPGAQIILGGYYYTSDAKEFLKSDADVLCVGEGEVRLPAVVRAIRDGAPLDAIRGLYLRGRDGRLTFTGEAEPLDLNQIAPVDYRLAERIEPPVSLENDVIEFGLETQRGCVFKCEFCTYRTLSTINVMEVDEAAGRIANTRLARRGLLTLTDATATFPHDRWEDMLRRIIDRGGSPHPIWAFARVSDISDRTAELMARAGVREVFIGQESGDQRILNRMKKGTRVDQVKPAVRAIARHGMTAFFSFIHGFPGEDAESIAATRTMIAELNQWSPSRPVSLWYKLDPFVVFDFAAVAQNEMKGVDHYLGYNSAPYSPQRACSAVLETFLATSRVPDAPVYEYVLGLMNFTNKMPTMATQSMYTTDRIGVYRWLKAVERGVAIFAERDLEGKWPNDQELRRVRDSIAAHYPTGRRRSAGARLTAPVMLALVRRVLGECSQEGTKGIGPLTRTLLAGIALSDTGRVGPALKCLARGGYAARGATPVDHAPSAPEEQVDVLATQLVTQSIDAASRSRKLLRVATRPRADAAATTSSVPPA